MEGLVSQVFEARKRILGDEHPATLLAMETLATTYKWQDRWEEAELLCEQVNDIRQTFHQDLDNNPQSAWIMSDNIKTYKLQESRNRPWPSPDRSRTLSTMSDDSTLSSLPATKSDEKINV